MTESPKEGISNLQARFGDTHLELLATAVEQAWESVCITDANLDAPGPRFVYCNHGFEVLTGYTKEEALALTPRVLQGPLTDRSVIARLKQNMREGVNFHGESVNYRKDGTSFWMEWKISPVKNDDGLITHFIAFQRDVTPLKDAQRHAAELSSIMAHELKAPLTALNGALGLLRNNYEPDFAEDLLGVGIDSIKRLLRLINDVLDIEKAGDGKFELKLEAVSVRRLFAGVQAMLQNYLPDGDLHIKLDLPEELEIIVDQDRITQVLINLAANALKYSPRGGTVTLRGEMLDKDRVRLSVSDRGPRHT